jgi:hypothetical protein
LKFTSYDENPKRTVAYKILPSSTIAPTLSVLHTFRPPCGF